MNEASWSWALSRLALFCGCLTFLLVTGTAAQAANTTAAGVVEAEPGDGIISITAPYTGDDNGDNSLKIEWDEDGGDWSALVGETTLPHNASPYTYKITGLTNGAAYQVRVTYLETDPDTVSGDAVQTLTGLVVYNRLLHNSLTTGSSKWTAEGGWGVAGGKYGEFTCNTCHMRGAPNIKRVRGSITAPDGTGTLPGEGQPISFQSAVDGSSDFGDDDPTGADGTPGHATSDRICEICHSLTNHHNYNTANNNTVGLSHFNKTDCTACHAHSEGFKAGACSSCHGGGTSGGVEKNFWPDGSSANAENDEPGRHLAHMDALAQKYYGVDALGLLDLSGADSKQVDLCGYCHDNPGADADHSTAGQAETAFHPAWDKNAAAAGAVAVDGSCANIACHNNKLTDISTYGWGWFGSGPSQCLMCHTDMTDTATVTGNTHADHTGAAARFGLSISCSDCHDAATSWAGNTKPASGHLNGSLDMTGAVSLSYTGSSPPSSSFGNCGTNACHNNGTAAFGAPLNNTYIWSDTGLSDCGICHLGVPASGSHPAHANTAEDIYGSSGNTSWNAWDANATATDVYDFGCGQCHGDTLAAHLNGARTLAGTGWNGSTCSATYCHSGLDVNNARVYAITPAWGGSFSGDPCAACHGNSPPSGGHEEHQVGFHYNAIYSGLKDFAPVVNADPPPAGLITGPADNGDADAMDDSYDPLRGHGGKLADGTITSTTMSCYVCHSDTVTDKGNDLNPVCGACHDGSGDPAKAPLMGTMAVANTNVHVNNQVDVVFVNEKIRSKAQVRNDLADVPELTNNWTRVNSYKQPDGSSYDESPQTLAAMATAYGGWTTADVTRYAGTEDEMLQPARTCLISCHLWEKGRVDKYPIHWENNSIHGPQPIMCIDCHSRLPM